MIDCQPLVSSGVPATCNGLFGCGEQGFARRQGTLAYRPMPTLNELLHAASRTFAIGIDLLPQPLRAQVEAAYLLLRVSDYLEDNVSMDAERKVTLLEAWAAVLAGEASMDPLEAVLAEASEESPDALVARHARQVHGALALQGEDAQRLIRRHVRDSTLGMARWARRGPAIEEEADLDDYMHEVAGRVGWLLTKLFALHVPQVAAREQEMMTLGREFGLALQTVNVIRGLHVDWQRGWVYVPRSFLREAGGSAEEVFGAAAPSPELEMAVLSRLVQKAERHLGAALGYTACLPRRRHGIRVFCLLPYFFAVRTLALVGNDPRVFREEAKITRAEVHRIVRAVRLLGWSNRWVAWYSGHLQEGARAPAGTAAATPTSPGRERPGAPPPSPARRG